MIQIKLSFPGCNVLSPLGLQGPSVASAARSPRDARSVLSTRGDPTLWEANVSFFSVETIPFASLLKSLLKHAACVLQELIFNGLFGDEGSARICPLNSREDLKEGVEQMELMEPMQLGDGRKDWRHRHQLSKNSKLYLTRRNAQACRTRCNLLSCGYINGALRKHANTRIKVLWLAFARK